MSTINRQRKSRNPSTRVNLRIHPRIKSVLVRAAKLRHLNLTEFMIESSRVAADIALADRTRFVLSPEKWREFNAALDAPTRDLPALRALFKEGPIFNST